MKLSNRDFHRLALPLAILLLLCGIAGALAWATHRDARQAQIERDRANEAKLRSEARLRQFRSDELDIKERGQLLQRLRDSSILGEEKRLDWTEQLGTLQRELRIPGMKYEFAPQTALQANGSAATTGSTAPCASSSAWCMKATCSTFWIAFSMKARPWSSCATANWPCHPPPPAITKRTRHSMAIANWTG